MVAVLAGVVMMTEGEAWLKAWCAVTSSSNCCSEDSARRWADGCIELMKRRGYRFDSKDEINRRHSCICLAKTPLSVEAVGDGEG